MFLNSSETYVKEAIWLVKKISGGVISTRIYSFW